MSEPTLALAFAVISFGFMYLATNTNEEHVHLQILNYLLAYVTVGFTGYVSYATVVSSTEADLPGLLTGFNGAYAFIIYLVFAYFGIWMLSKVLKTMSGDD